MTQSMTQSGSREPVETIYRGLTRAQLDAAYNNMAAGADRPGRHERWLRDSARLRDMPSARLDIPYAEKERTKIDYLPSGAPNAPLFVFIHGGYWQRNHKDMFAFVADGLHPHGIDVALVGYTLAPEASLTAIVSEISRSIDFLAARSLGYDVKRLFVGGWSAGGHLTALMCSHPGVKGGIAISGLYDLEPISLCYLNANLHLTGIEVEDLSPARQQTIGAAPLDLFVGSAELPSFKWQAANFADLAGSRGGAVRMMKELPGHTHFTILDELADPAGRIALHVKSLVQQARQA
jgi:arylformamidase